MATQPATKRNKNAPETLPALDLTFGFPGQLPQNIRHTQLIQEYVKCGEIQAAAKACGYSFGWAKRWAPEVLKKHHDFVVWLQAQRAQAVVKVVGVDQQQVLDEIMRIAFANEHDYLVFFEKDEQDEATHQKTGKKVPWCRRKYVHELTREQLAAVVVFRRGGKGSIDWKWRDRDHMLELLGKHLGLFNEKIIMEHRHRHLHMNFDLAGVPMKDLEDIEGQFEALMGRGGDAEK
jgi:hypothetical protein